MKEIEQIAGIPQKVKAKLRSMPHTLQDIYKSVVKQIKEDDREEVRRLLMWLLLAPKPLLKPEFAELLAFQFEHDNHTPLFNPMSRVYTPNDALTLISSTFVSCHRNDGEDHEEVRLAHASVKDFLLGLPPDEPLHIDTHLAHCTVVRMCISYMNYAGVGQPLPADRGELPYPLLRYTATTWLVLAEVVIRTGKSDLDSDMRSFLSQNHGAFVKTLLRRLDNPHYSRNVFQTISEAPSAAKILMNYADIHATDEVGQTLLHQAAKAGKMSYVLLLHERGADMEARDVDEETPLHLAIRRAVAAPDIPGHLIAIRGANINAQNIDGKTPLHIAVGEGTPQVARDLINLGADIDLADNDGRTPLHEAVVLGWEETARLLIARGAFIGMATRGSTLLHDAAEGGNSEIFRMLMEGDTKSAADSRDSTALPSASQMKFRSPQIKRPRPHSTVASSRRTSAKNDNSEDTQPFVPSAPSTQSNPRSSFIREGHIAGINVNALNKHGETPLQSAAGIFFDKGALEIMRMLVSKGADVKVLDDDKILKAVDSLTRLTWNIIPHLLGAHRDGGRKQDGIF